MLFAETGEPVDGNPVRGRMEVRPLPSTTKVRSDSAACAHMSEQVLAFEGIPLKTATCSSCGFVPETWTCRYETGDWERSGWEGYRLYMPGLKMLPLVQAAGGGVGVLLGGAAMLVVATGGSAHGSFS